MGQVDQGGEGSMQGATAETAAPGRQRGTAGTVRSSTGSASQKPGPTCHFEVDMQLVLDGVLQPQVYEGVPLEWDAAGVISVAHIIRQVLGAYIQGNYQLQRSELVQRPEAGGGGSGRRRPVQLLLHLVSTRGRGQPVGVEAAAAAPAGPRPVSDPGGPQNLAFADAGPATGTAAAAQVQGGALAARAETGREAAAAPAAAAAATGHPNQGAAAQAAAVAPTLLGRPLKQATGPQQHPSQSVVAVDVQLLLDGVLLPQVFHATYHRDAMGNMHMAGSAELQAACRRYELQRWETAHEPGPGGSSSSSSRPLLRLWLVTPPGGRGVRAPAPAAPKQQQQQQQPYHLPLHLLGAGVSAPTPAKPAPPLNHVPAEAGVTGGKPSAQPVGPMLPSLQAPQGASKPRQSSPATPAAHVHPTPSQQLAAPPSKKPRVEAGKQLQQLQVEPGAGPAVQQRVLPGKAGAKTRGAVTRHIVANGPARKSTAGDTGPAVQETQRGSETGPAGSGSGATTGGKGSVEELLGAHHISLAEAAEVLGPVHGLALGEEREVDLQVEVDGRVVKEFQGVHIRRDLGSWLRPQLLHCEGLAACTRGLVRRGLHLVQACGPRGRPVARLELVTPHGASRGGSPGPSNEVAQGMGSGSAGAVAGVPSGPGVAVAGEAMTAKEAAGAAEPQTTATALPAAASHGGENTSELIWGSLHGLPDTVVDTVAQRRSLAPSAHGPSKALPGPVAPAAATIPANMPLHLPAMPCARPCASGPAAGAVVEGRLGPRQEMAESEMVQFNQEPTASKGSQLGPASGVLTAPGSHARSGLAADASAPPGLSEPASAAQPGLGEAAPPFVEQQQHGEAGAGVLAGAGVQAGAQMDGAGDGRQDGGGLEVAQVAAALLSLPSGALPAQPAPPGPAGTKKKRKQKQPGPLARPKEAGGPAASGADGPGLIKLHSSCIYLPARYTQQLLEQPGTEPLACGCNLPVDVEVVLDGGGPQVYRGVPLHRSSKTGYLRVLHFPGLQALQGCQLLCWEGGLGHVGPNNKGPTGRPVLRAVVQTAGVRHGEQAHGVPGPTPGPAPVLPVAAPTAKRPASGGAPADARKRGHLGSSGSGPGGAAAAAHQQAELQPGALHSVDDGQGPPAAVAAVPQMEAGEGRPKNVEGRKTRAKVRGGKPQGKGAQAPAMQQGGEDGGQRGVGQEEQLMAHQEGASPPPVPDPKREGLVVAATSGPGAQATAAAAPTNIVETTDAVGQPAAAGQEATAPQPAPACSAPTGPAQVQTPSPIRPAPPHEVALHPLCSAGGGAPAGPSSNLPERMPLLAGISDPGLRRHLLTEGLATALEAGGASTRAMLAVFGAVGAMGEAQERELAQVRYPQLYQAYARRATRPDLLRGLLAQAFPGVTELAL